MGDRRIIRREVNYKFFSNAGMLDGKIDENMGWF